MSGDGVLVCEERRCCACREVGEVEGEKKKVDDEEKRKHAKT